MSEKDSLRSGCRISPHVTAVPREHGSSATAEAQAVAVRAAAAAAMRTDSHGCGIFFGSSLHNCPSVLARAPFSQKLACALCCWPARVRAWLGRRRAAI